jgi:hypothetical protein
MTTTISKPKTGAKRSVRKAGHWRNRWTNEFGSNTTDLGDGTGRGVHENPRLSRPHLPRTGLLSRRCRLIRPDSALAELSHHQNDADWRISIAGKPLILLCV